MDYHRHLTPDGKAPFARVGYSAPQQSPIELDRRRRRTPLETKPTSGDGRLAVIGCNDVTTCPAQDDIASDAAGDGITAADGRLDGFNEAEGNRVPIERRG